MARRLRALFQEVDFADVQASASCEYYGYDERVRWVSENLPRGIDDTAFVDKVMELGLVDLETLRSMDNAWHEWGKHPDSFAAAIWCEAVGWKK